MNQDIDLTELWEWINHSVDWLMAGVFVLIGVNVLFLLFFIYSVVFQPSFYERYDVRKSSQFVQKANNLSEVPDIEDIKVEPPSVNETLPDRYAKLRDTNMFVPLGQRQLASPEKPEKKRKPENRTLPQIEGYELIGRISEGTHKLSLVRRIKDGRTFIAREGEYLSKQTDIKVKTVTDTMVVLTQPQHQPTQFRFTMDEIKEGIKAYRSDVKLH
ncbi:MAG: hypothetical protein ABEK50_10265 [bacterium]